LPETTEENHEPLWIAGAPYKIQTRYLVALYRYPRFLVSVVSITEESQEFKAVLLQVSTTYSNIS